MIRGLRWLAWALGWGTLVLACAGAAAYLLARERITRSYRVEPDRVAVRDDPASLERGRHLAEAVIGCTHCHGFDYAGKQMADDPWLGRLWAPNLTPGRGGLAGYSDADWVRSIRHGVKPDGRPVLMMPSQYLYHLSDADLAALIAHLRRLPPIDRETPDERLGVISVLAIASGRVPDLIPAEQLAHAPPRVPSPEPRVSRDYGAYLVEASGCKVCHRDDLSGGLHPLALPDEPAPPDLTPRGRLASWSEEDFVRTLRTGVTPDGRRLDPTWMPWPMLARMSDVELRAMWRYLRSVPVS